MKNILKAILIAVFTLSVAFAFVACDSGESNDPYDYTVTIKDGDGNPIKGIIIKLFDSDGTQVGGNVTGADGKVTFSEVINGQYKIKLSKGVTKYNFSKTEYDVTTTSDGYTITLHNEPKDKVDIYGPAVGEGGEAYVIGSGSYFTNLTPGEMTYFVFYVDMSGVYSVDFLSDESGMSIGYYGAPSYVLDYHCLGDGSVPYDGKGFDIEIPDINTPHIIGIKSETATDCIFNITRKSDLPFRPEYVDWTDVNAYADLSKYTLAEGATLGEFDITDKNLSIVLEKNGKYYTQDGKLIVMRLASASQNSALAYEGFLSLKDLAGFSGNTSNEESAGAGVGNVGMNIGGYIYDEDGNFITKKSYNNMIKTYLEYCDDKTGVYPLTDELLDMIKVHGNSAGWWKPNTVNYLFDTEFINQEMAWLFMCSYVIE